MYVLYVYSYRDLHIHWFQYGYIIIMISYIFIYIYKHTLYSGFFFLLRLVRLYNIQTYQVRFI